MIRPTLASFSLAAVLAVLTSAACSRGAAELTRKLPWHDHGIWLQGETHTHYLLRRSPGAAMIEAAAASGIDFIASTNHAQAAFKNYPGQTIDALRREYPGLLILAGIEWNVPAGDHATVLVEQGPGEWELLERFSEQFDRKANPELESLEAEDPGEGEDDGGTWGDLELAKRGLEWLRAEGQKEGLGTAVYLNHLARHGYLSVAQIDELQRAGLAGFEAAPGHQILLSDQPTVDRYDPFIAAAGGGYDRLPRKAPFGISAGSDFHKTETAYYPGTFSRTFVYAPERSTAGVIEALAAGATATVLGGVVTVVQTRASIAGGQDGALVGEALRVSRGSELVFSVLVDVPAQDALGAANRLDEVEVLWHAGDAVRTLEVFTEIGLGPKRLDAALPAEATASAGTFYLRARGRRRIGGEGNDPQNADYLFYTAATEIVVD